MKKKLLALVAGLCMMASLTACGSEAASNDIVSISQYKGLKVEAVEAEEVTEQMVDESIAYTLQATAGDYGITDRAAVDGDTVIIDYEGKKDGVAFDGGTAQKQSLTLGSDTFIDGFEDAIIGHMPGETFDIDLTFPEDYGNTELAGQDVVFTVVFHSIVPTEITDEIATALVGSETTVAEYRTQVKEDLELSNKETAESEYGNAVYSAFIDNCTMKEYPEEELNKWTSIMNEMYSTYAAYYGMETDEFVQQNFGMTCEEMAKEQVCYTNAALLVAEKEGIKLTAEEYEELLAEQAAQYGYNSIEEFEADYDEYYGEGFMKNSILQDKVMEWIIDNSVTVK